WWVRRIYLILIMTVVGSMLLHNGLLFVKKLKAARRATARPVLRMTPAQRWQHFALLASFIALAITGFALKFPDSWIARLMGSNEPFRRWTHRIAGVVLLLAGAFHLVYIIATPAGRQLVKDFLPTWKDLKDIVGAARYLVGLTPAKPKVGRFGYAEKMEYW